ncbi:hypothetical protein [uncultured Aquimarina sp.]|uniref:hypothetical protein n=1 Tax=uncultured Aquimarina sp. TaxID=575652 RepID=UPI0026266ED3|nr:hypothetical protein [uncultured Aquimarina sp.]
MKNKIQNLTGINLLNKEQQKIIGAFSSPSLAGAEYNCFCKNSNVEWTQTAESAVEAAESISSKCDDGQGACY